MKPMTADELEAAVKIIKERLDYLKRLRENALAQQLGQAAQFIDSHIWGIEFVMEQLSSPDTPFVFESNGNQYITIGDVKYPVELDKSLLPGEWYIRGKADDSKRT